jgi:hypothetical protein
MSAIAQARGATGVLDDLAQRLAELIAQRGAHAARTVVLVPYAQLMPLARRAWARQAPDGFTPRFETTMNWAARGGFAPGPQDLSFDRGLDLLTARFWPVRPRCWPRNWWMRPGSSGASRPPFCPLHGASGPPAPVASPAWVWTTR